MSRIETKQAMKPVGGISKPAEFARSRMPRDKPAVAATAPRATAGRALIPLQPIERNEPARQRSWHPAAGFLAHLISTERGLPQTRERRRVPAADAIAAYRAVRRRLVCGRNFTCVM
jgi:hypothetical protein